MADHGMKVGTPAIESVGALAFGPDDVLFVADNAQAKVVALDVGHAGAAAGHQPFDVEGLDAKLASFLGCELDDVRLRDLAVHPHTGTVYLSVMRGRGADATPCLLRLDRADASLSEVPLRDVPFSETAITNAPSPDDERLDLQLAQPPDGEELQFGDRTFRVERHPVRQVTVTDMAFANHTLLVAGMSNEEFSSNLRRIPFPFTGEQVDNRLEIFHVSHGMWETAAPIRTFVPYDDGRSILASYTCTPLVHFSLEDAAATTKLTGTTVAELGAGNQPLDMVSFTKDGVEHLLIAHSTHPMMKVASDGIAGQEPLTQPQEPRGIPFEEIDIPGVAMLANLDDEHVLALQRDDDGQHLRSLKVTTL